MEAIFLTRRYCFRFIICLLLGLGFLILDLSPTMAANEAAHSINAFALRAAKNLGENLQEDFFLSPWSIITALGMVYAGAEGETAREMEQALMFNPELHASLGKLVQDFTTQLNGQNGQVTLTSANQLWIQKGLTLLPKFTKILRQDYKSPVVQMNFVKDPDGSKTAINQWVENHTNHRIKNLINQIYPGTRMILTNAVYFLGQWRYPFNDKRTAPEPFYIATSNTKNVPMMRQVQELAFAEIDGGIKLLKLPYMSRISMFLALPKQGEIGNILNQLADNPTLFDQWLRILRRYRVDLRLPKFKAEKRYEMSNLLNDLGIKLAFGNKADFSGITAAEPLRIDSVIHKTFIDVNERETEAAAATAIMMKNTAVQQPQDIPKAEFHANRPFLYFILDEPTGTILFVGCQSFR